MPEYLKNQLARDEDAARFRRRAEASCAAGDVVQITDEDDDWYGVLLVLTEAPPGRRLMGFASHPLRGEAYRFVQREQVALIGRAALDLSERDGEAA